MTNKLVDDEVVDETMLKLAHQIRKVSEALLIFQHALTDLQLRIDTLERR
jgi:hypothetical protein